MNRLAVAILLVLALTGCDTVNRRIQQKSAVFASLSPAEQQSLREGKVEVGYTEDMAYIALGQPDEVKERHTEAGTTKTWVYLSYSEDYQGQQFVGFRRHVFQDRRTGRIYVAYYPVDAPIYEERIEEVLRVEFKDGKVVALEQPKE